MSFAALCTHCRRKIVVPDRYKGEVVICTECGCKFQADPVPTTRKWWRVVTEIIAVVWILSGLALYIFCLTMMSDDVGIGWAAMILLAVPCGTPLVIAGVGVLRRARWAYYFALIVSVFVAGAFVPFGAVAGVLMFIGLLKTRDHYRKSPKRKG